MVYTLQAINNSKKVDTVSNKNEQQLILKILNYVKKLQSY